MTNVEERLANCFRAVFPEISDEEIPGASTKTLKGWDSVAAITLVTVLEEEFEITLDFEAILGLDSFERILAYLKAI